MSRALVTQLVEALEKLSDTEQTYVALDKADAVIKAAREYLATEPSGERASLLRRANTSVAALDSRIMEPFYCTLDQDASRVLSDCIDMLEADAHPKQVTCQIYGHVVGACVECNTHIEAQQAISFRANPFQIFKDVNNS